MEDEGAKASASSPTPRATNSTVSSQQNHDSDQAHDDDDEATVTTVKPESTISSVSNKVSQNSEKKVKSSKIVT